MGIPVEDEEPNRQQGAVRVFLSSVYQYKYHDKKINPIRHCACRRLVCM
jgi:hypothetical protein